MAETINPLTGMSSAELAQRFPGYYPPAIPKETPIASPPDLSRQQLAAAHPEFYPQGIGPKVADLPRPEVNPRQWMSPNDLRQSHPEFYDPPPPASTPASIEPGGGGIPRGSYPGNPEIPTTGTAGGGLGNYLATPGGAGVAGGIITGIAGIASGLPLEVAAGSGIGAGLGTYGGALLGVPFGPAGILIGGSIGGAIGGNIGGRLGQNIHDFFHPPKADFPRPKLPREPLPPLTGSRYTLYRVTAVGKIKGRPAETFVSTLIGPITGVVQRDVGDLKGYGIGSNGGAEYNAYMSAAEELIDQPLVITGCKAVNGTADPSTAPGLNPSPNYQQTPGPGVPFGVDFGPGLPQTALPPTLPQTAPAPATAPELEPQRSPARSPGTTAPPTTDPNKPTKQPETVPPENAPPNLNNAPGLFGLPFIPPVMPSNRPSPPGSLDIDPGNGPTGTGKPPKAPTNTPCNSACQRAIEGRIQGVDDKMGKLLQGGNNAAQDAALAAIMARLEIMDAKLGAQAAGGLSGLLANFRAGFERFAKWSQLDRVLSIMTFAVTFHNAYMLSNQLSQTLFSMISNVLAAVGLKDHEGNPFQIGSVLEKSIESIAKSMLGAPTVDGIKAEWKKYNRIYQAAANILWSIQSISSSITAALEVIGSYVGKIGNALRKWRVVGEKAYSWMNPQPNFQNRFFTALESTQNVVSQVDQVASEVLNIETTVANIGTQANDIQKALKEETGTKAGTPTPEAAKVAAAAIAAKTASATPPIPTTTQSKPEG